MCTLDTPQRVALPNGRAFLARYHCVSRSQLPAKVVLKRTYRQRAVPRGGRRQQARGLFSFIKKAVEHPAVRSLAKQGVKYLPGLYNAATSRRKNDKLRKTLQSGTAHGLLNKVVDRYSN